MTTASSDDPRKPGVIMRVAGEPLAHFMAAGAILFALNTAIHGGGPPPADMIVISEGRVAQLAESFQLLSSRPPSRTELDALVDDFVREEIAYREAVALGLDADDTVVRRRMRQKLEFLLEDMDALDEPTDADLAAWLADHPDRYLIPERRAIRQVLASSDTRSDARGDAAGFRDRLAGGADPAKLGDPSLLPDALPLTSGDGVANLFGQAFADAVFATAETGWIGPVQSSFGEHAVLVLDREPPRAPELEDVRELVRTDWIDARRTDRRATHDKALRDRYDVRIDWPDALRPRE